MEERLYKILFAVSGLLMAIFVVVAQSRMDPRGSEAVEATVTILGVEPQGRSVTFTGPRGETRTIPLPPAVQVETLRPGEQLHIRFIEPTAVQVSKEGSAATGGSAPGSIRRAAGVVEAIDAVARRVVLRTPRGDTLALAVARSINLKDISVGEQVHVSYTETIAVEAEPRRGGA